MKKQLLMLVAVLLLVLPSQANDLADELCADEVFIKTVREGERLASHLKSLNVAQREAFLSTEEFACFRESFMKNTEYLAKTYNIFERAEGKTALHKAIKKSMKQVDPAVCEWYFTIFYYNCYSIYDPFAQQDCFTEAIRLYNQCMGNGGGGVG